MPSEESRRAQQAGRMASASSNATLIRRILPKDELPLWSEDSLKLYEHLSLPRVGRLAVESMRRNPRHQVCLVDDLHHLGVGSKHDTLPGPVHVE